MMAGQGRDGDLLAALRTLADQIGALPGVLRVEILRDPKAPADFRFAETWESAEAAAAGGRRLGREAFAPVMAPLAVPPVTVQYDCL